jgi:hypothetical protein
MQPESFSVTSGSSRESNGLTMAELFYAGYMFDRDCYHGVLPMDVIQVLCTINRLLFRYQSDFDQNGVLSWFKDSPIPRRLIDIKHVVLFKVVRYAPSFVYEGGKINSDLHEVIGKAVPGVFYSVESDSDNACPVIDLQQFKLFLTHITMFQHSRNLYKFYGSNDRILWSRIHEEDRSSSKVVARDDKSKTWELQSSEYFRFFKLSMYFCKEEGKKRYRSSLAGLELYGYLI